MELDQHGKPIILYLPTIFTLSPAFQGDTAVLQCPPGSTGFAKWHCQPSGNSNLPRARTRAEWEPRGPTLAECRSLWLGELDSKLRGGLISVGNVSRILSEKTSEDAEAGVLYGGDLVLGARMLKHMAERMHYDLQVNSIFFCFQRILISHEYWLITLDIAVVFAR